MRFNSDKFSFNGIHCSTKEVSLLWGKEMFIDYGLNINYQLKYDGISWELKDEQPETITLHIVHEVDNIPKVWTREKIRDIESWLISEDFLPFVSDDNLNVSYYLKVVNIVRKFNSQMMGWLEVEFQPFKNCGFINKTISLKNAARFLNMKTPPSLTINNESEIEDINYPIIKIKNLNGEVRFNNLTTGKELTVTGNGNIIIDNKMKTIYDENGLSLLTESNRNWLFLSRGINKIQVTGNCDVDFDFKFEVRI